MPACQLRGLLAASGCTSHSLFTLYSLHSLFTLHFLFAQAVYHAQLKMSQDLSQRLDTMASQVRAGLRGCMVVRGVIFTANAFFLLA